MAYMKWIASLDELEVAYLEAEIEKESRIIDFNGIEYELEFIKNVIKIKNGNNGSEESEPQ
tara:strand:+ start:505 stop:687 length:183 start_codon:yes stop_codon:yes gene_type:complete